MWSGEASLKWWHLHWEKNILSGGIAWQGFRRREMGKAHSKNAEETSMAWRENGEMGWRESQEQVLQSYRPSPLFLAYSTEEFMNHQSWYAWKCGSISEWGPYSKCTWRNSQMWSYTWLWLYGKNYLYVCSTGSGWAIITLTRSWGVGFPCHRLGTEARKGYVTRLNHTANKKQTQVHALSSLLPFFKMCPKQPFYKHEIVYILIWFWWWYKQAEKCSNYKDFAFILRAPPLCKFLETVIN